MTFLHFRTSRFITRYFSVNYLNMFLFYCVVNFSFIVHLFHFMPGGFFFKFALANMPIFFIKRQTKNNSTFYCLWKSKQSAWFFLMRVLWKIMNNKYLTSCRYCFEQPQFKETAFEFIVCGKISFEKVKVDSSSIKYLIAVL